MTFNTPLRVAIANVVRGGNLPLWNPYMFSGMPLLATAQGGVLFPLNWFYLVFSPALATNLMVVSSYMLAALGAYLYTRRSGSSKRGAMVTSLCWSWGGFLIGQIGHINIVHTGAMLPWILWTVDSYAATQNRKWAILLAIFVALQVFAGHQQTFVYSLLVIVAYTIAAAITRKNTRYLEALAGIAAGVMLSAVQILPTFELLRNSVRSEASYSFFTSFSLPFRMIETFVAPYVLGGGDGRLFRATYVGAPYYGEMAGYIGALGLMLVFAAVILRRDAITRFWIAVVLVGLTLCLGQFLPLQLYKIFYHIPILNLFRVPARHLLEVEFALAVLAGRGLTALTSARATRRGKLVAVAVGGGVFLLTCLVVTWGRPDYFRAGRDVSITLLRVPELFVPVAIAAASGWALWRFARGYRGATALLMILLVFDLALWGQSSGWRLSSPTSSDSLFGLPDTVKFLRDREGPTISTYRILTMPHSFDPAARPIPPSVSHSFEFNLWTQPDIYMMHGIPNAAGYDGFGLARYSRLAGDMKVWGELTDPDRSLRTATREIDLLNVRYLLSMRRNETDDKEPARASQIPAAAQATKQIEGLKFAEEDLGLPNLNAGKRLSFEVPGVMTDRIALITNLSWAEAVSDGTTVAHLRLFAFDGREFDFNIRAGSETAEWAYDRPDIRARVRHKRPTIAMSYKVVDAAGEYDAHNYLALFSLPERVGINRGEIETEALPKSPDVLLGIFRISLVENASGATYALTRNEIGIGATDQKTKSSARENVPQRTNHWQLLAPTPDVDIYENTNALPRVWLASDARALNEQTTLEVIRSGRLPDGSPWDPLRTALVESEVASVLADTTGQAHSDITTYEPNRVQIHASSTRPSLLVLSENHYPGWRAYVDGQSVEVMRVNYNQRGVALPAGNHLVTFVYRPKSVLIGLLFSLLTFAVLGLWAAGFARPTVRARD